MKVSAGDIVLDNQRIAVTVTRSRRRHRTMAFSMNDAAQVNITAPWRASLSSIRAMVDKHAGWIRRRLTEMQKIAQQPTRQAALTYLGYALSIETTQDSAQPFGCRCLPHRLMVNLPVDDLSPQAVQSEARLEILLWLKKKARRKFRQRVDLWAERLGVRESKVMIADASRRWGSCNAQNVIRLNWRLVMAPLPILDYVVVHELCHIRHKNHGPKFWGQVASVMPDYKTHRHYLRTAGESLFAVLSR